MFHRRRVDHYISFDSSDDIDRIVGLVEGQGFTVAIERLPRRYVATISDMARPSPWYMWRMERKFRALAATLKVGHYDGYGVGE